MLNKNQIAIFMNTNQLGGAERSVIEQFSILPRERYHFFLPRLRHTDHEIREFLISKGFSNIQYYDFPNFLYELSRRDRFALFKFIILSPLLIVSFVKLFFILKRYSQIYLNGNKAGFFISLVSALSFRRSHLYWHLRDFPSPAFFRWLKILIHYSVLKKNIEFIANSHAVQRSIKVLLPTVAASTIYNLAGDLQEKAMSSLRISHIGVVSMHAPWKGLHVVVIMCSLFERELKELGIQSVRIYGDDIYLTQKDQGSYTHQLRELIKKFPSSLIVFAGKKSPQTIFQEIDLLIHCSLEPEPFGRVILEAYQSRVPVLSTGLGGAGELAQDHLTCLCYEAQDYQGLFRLISELQSQTEMRVKIIQEAFQFSQKMNAETIKVLAQKF